MTATVAVFLLTLMGARYSQLSSINTLGQAHFDRSLAQYLLQTNALGAAESSGSAAECFNRFLPMLSEVDSSYSTQFQACALIGKMLSANLMTQAAYNRQKLSNETNSVCNALNACNTSEDDVTFFNCYATVTSQDVVEMSQIWTNATSAQRTLTQGMQFIRNEQEQCMNATQATFIANTAATYRLLEECLKNGPAGTTLNPLKAFDGDRVCSDAKDGGCRVKA